MGPSGSVYSHKAPRERAGGLHASVGGDMGLSLETQEQAVPFRRYHQGPPCLLKWSPVSLLNRMQKKAAREPQKHPVLKSTHF